MNVVWITNVELPTPARYFHRETVVGGWMDLSSTLLAKREDIKLYIISNCSDYHPIEIDGITYIGFDSSGDVRNNLRRYIDKITPDIIHIWGSEFPHSRIAVDILESRELLDRTVVSIQGLVSVYPLHYFEGVPARIAKSATLYELLRRNSLQKSFKSMIRQGEKEKEIFNIINHCIGRTDWDKACALQMNRNIHYHKCNEILRAGFYNYKWDISECKKRKIAFSQAHYPIKGAHYLLKAIDIVKRFYPDVTVEILGESPFKEGLTNKIRCTTYMKYLKKLERQYHIENNVVWIGKCNEDQMIDHYLSSNVFVCASTIENSSNSIGEAMLLGMPIIASDVGGVKSIITHEKEGLLYQADAPYMLADSIMRIFKDEKMAIHLGDCARSKALSIHNREKNTETLYSIYYEMVEKNEERN